MINTSTTSLTIAEAHQLLRQKSISPTELVSFYLDHIEKVEPKVKAWVTILKERALEKAKVLENRMKDATELPSLFAIPFGAKDIIYTKGIPTEGGSQVLKGFIPEYDATVIKMLNRSGAILLGKTTTTEFANWGSPPETRNPWNLSHTPGGSSSGSAAALASGMALMTLGTQTAGSLSRPAAYNGLTILKATYGRISKHGIIPASWSLDHVGAFTKTVEDTVIVYNELSGPDEADSSTWTLPKQKLRLQVEKEYKIGIVVDDYFENTSTEISMACEEAVKQLKKIGYSITYVQLPYSLKAANAAQHMVMKAETANYHADQYTVDSSRYGGYLQQFIREGLDIKANDYLKAQKIRSVFRDELSDVFKHVDLLLTPATPTVAPEGILATGSPAYNLPFTNAGVPTLTLPIGMSGELPIGMQLIAAPLQEQKLVDVGYLLQQQTDWHLKTPSMNR
ncbi:amidase [Metabacillus litoralis]|uniref:amidase n=1 Tax=Metabacillus litoralis TaxID=152268 RepID=UPI00203B394D|nr:amidase [Metabacillus litoralis]MCM3653813.1 amidase [Metabacillus litoralis]